MQIKRLLDDREVFAGDRLLDAQGRSYAFVELSNVELICRPVIIWSQPRQYIRQVVIRNSDQIQVRFDMLTEIVTK